MNGYRFKRIWIALFGMALFFIAIAIVGGVLGKQKLLGREVLVDLNSARIRRIRYLCFIKTSDYLTTNATAGIALSIFPESKERWKLVEREWFFSRTFDEYPETRLLTSIDVVNRLVDNPFVNQSQKTNIVENFIEVLRTKSPRDAQAFAEHLQSEYFK